MPPTPGKPWLCGPPRHFPRAAKHSRRGCEGFPAEKTDAGTQNLSLVFGVHPLESDGLPPKTGKFCGPLLRFPSAAKHSRRRLEGFPAEKTDAGTQNWSPVFSGSSPSNQTIHLQKRSNFASPPAGFRGPQSTHVEGVRVSQLRKWSPVCKI